MQKGHRAVRLEVHLAISPYVPDEASPLICGNSEVDQRPSGCHIGSHKLIIAMLATALPTGQRCFAAHRKCNARAQKPHPAPCSSKHHQAPAAADEAAAAVRSSSKRQLLLGAAGLLAAGPLLLGRPAAAEEAAASSSISRRVFFDVTGVRRGAEAVFLSTNLCPKTATTWRLPHSSTCCSGPQALWSVCCGGASRRPSNWRPALP